MVLWLRAQQHQLTVVDLQVRQAAGGAVEQAGLETLAAWVTPAATTALAVRRRAAAAPPPPGGACLCAAPHPPLDHWAAVAPPQLHAVARRSTGCLSVPGADHPSSTAQGRAPAHCHRQAADLGGGSCIAISGHADGRLCRLRLAAPQAPGAALSQIELAGGGDFEGAALLPWLPLHAGAVADLALHADSREVRRRRGRCQSLLSCCLAMCAVDHASIPGRRLALRHRHVHVPSPVSLCRQITLLGVQPFICSVKASPPACACGARWPPQAAMARCTWCPWTPRARRRRRSCGRGPA